MYEDVVIKYYDIKETKHTTLFSYQTLSRHTKLLEQVGRSTADK